MTDQNIIPPEVFGYDWASAFECAGPADPNDPDRSEWSSVHNEPDVRRAIGDDSSVSRDPFTRSQIKRIIALAEGDNDGPDWLCLGHLTDGRYFALTAGCDYTGWDCQSGGSVTVASSEERALNEGFTPEDRARLIPLALSAGMPCVPDNGYPKDAWS